MDIKSIVQSAGTIFIIALEIMLIVGGTRGGRWFINTVLSPLRCGFRLFVQIAVIAVVVMIAWTAWRGHVHRPTQPQPPPKPDPHIAWSFDYPVGDPEEDGRYKGKGWYVSQDFADTINPYSPAKSGQHLGEDWLRNRSKRVNGSFAGERVRAIANGQVIVSGANTSYGHVVMLKHPLPAGSDLPYVISLYGHLGNDDLPAVGPDHWVTRGMVIGHIAPVGENGISKDGQLWPEHLHFELRADESRTHLSDSSIALKNGVIGYSPNHDGFLNPTDATSLGNTSGGGWIDGHR